MTIEATRAIVSSWRSPLERDPFEDALHVANGIHSSHPLSRELEASFEYQIPGIRIREIGAISLDASVQTREL